MIPNFHLAGNSEDRALGLDPGRAGTASLRKIEFVPQVPETNTKGFGRELAGPEMLWIAQNGLKLNDQGLGHPHAVKSRPSGKGPF